MTEVEMKQQLQEIQDTMFLQRRARTELAETQLKVRSLTIELLKIEKKLQEQYKQLEKSLSSVQDNFLNQEGE